MNPFRSEITVFNFTAQSHFFFHPWKALNHKKKMIWGKIK
jgi:hypothetical protein